MDKIQTFEKGLHSDNEPAMQPEGTYRDAKNGNLIAYGNNRFSFESVKGTTVSFSLPAHNTLEKFTVIGWKSFTDRLIVLSCAGVDSSLTYGEIGEVIFDNEGTGTYLQLYFHASLNFSIEAPIRNHDGIIGKPETLGIKRIYWTDHGRNPFRSFNVVDPRIRASDGTIATIASGSLVTGNQYMVLRSGANNNITHNATVYGPGEAGGNVFTAANANYTGSANVVEYIPLETLDVVPVVNMGQIEGKSIAFGGYLTSASYQYFYRLESADGAVTNWSYVTRPFYVPGTNIPSDQSISYAKHQGAINTTNSTKYITLTINDIDTNFSKISVGYIRGTELTVYETPKVFYSVEITGTSMDIPHYGNETEQALTLDDVTIPKPPLDYVGAISSTKNILFLGNVGLQNDPDFDMSGTATCDTLIYKVPADILGDIDNTDTIAAGFAVHGHGQTQNAATGNSVIYPGQWYEVAGDGTTYNAVAYNVGDYFQGVLGTTTHTPDSASTRVIAVIRLQQYTGTYKNVRIENDFCDFKGFLASHYLLSHWRGETYRVGIMLWSTKMAPLYVHFLTDKTFPQIYETDGELVDYSSGQLNLNLLGMSFSDLDFNLIATALGCTLAELPNFIGGFSIVRCERDEQIVCQGLLFPTMVNGNDTEALSISQIVDDFYYDAGADNIGRRPNVYTIYSPDNMLENGVTANVGFDGRPDYLQGDKLKIVDYFDSTDGAAAGLQLCTDDAGSKRRYYKYYDRVNPSTTPTVLSDKGDEVTIATDCFIQIDVAGLAVAVPEFGLPGDFNNRGTWDDGGTSRVGAGTKTVLVKIDADESLATGEVLGFGDHTAGSIKKPLVNQVRAKTNLYGGTSAEAKAANKYIWAGHFQALDDDFMTYLIGNSGIADDIEVMGGDCFVNIFDFCRIIHSGIGDNVGFGAVFPCESNVNVAMREGRTLNKDRMFHGTEAPDGIITVKNESWIARGAYSNKEHEVYYLHRPIGFISQDRNEHLIMYSSTKTDGEIIDKWKEFLVNNSKTVDGQYGGIVNLMAKTARLFVLQNRGITYLPVQERVTLGSTIGQVVQLGIGGTLDRNDELDFYYGCQHPFSFMEAEDYCAWFDFRRRAVIRMSYGGAIDKVAMVEGLSAFFNTVFDNAESESSPNIFDSDNPILGYGICSVYDSRFRAGFMTFKYSRTVDERVVQQDFTIGFSKNLDKYVGFFNFIPGVRIEHNGMLLSVKVSRELIGSNKEYFLGDDLTYNGINYVNIVGYTTGAVAANELQTNGTNWDAASNINDVYVSWRGDICKFHGIVYPFYIEAVLKDASLDNISVDNLEVAGNETNFTDVFIENGDGAASDENISTGNKNYKYFDGSWRFNLPLKNRRMRLTDHYLKVKMQVKNFLGDDIVTSLNQVKRLFYVKQSYRKRL